MEGVCIDGGLHGGGRLPHPEIRSIGGLVYTRTNVKAMSFPTCCIVSNLCIYTTVTAVVTKIKETNRFRVRSSTNAPLPARSCPNHHYNEPSPTSCCYSTNAPLPARSCPNRRYNEPSPTSCYSPLCRLSSSLLVKFAEISTTRYWVRRVSNNII